MMGEAVVMKQQQQEQRPDDQLVLANSCAGASGRRLCKHLPQELVEPILRRSSLWSTARLQLVSSLWAVAGRKATTSHPTPWMFLYTFDQETSRTTCRTTGYMVSICGDGASFVLKPLSCSLFAGSCDGWLVFGDANYRLRSFLLNPFTMSRIDLPALSSKCLFRLRSLYLWPSANAALGCCLMASLQDGVAIWKPGNESWACWKLDGWDDERIVSVVAFKGEFYALDRTQGSVYVIDFASSVLVPLGVPGLPLLSGRGLRQLVESQGELLLVHCTQSKLKGVYRLDLERKEWVEVRSLGKDRTLFVTPSSYFFRCPLTLAVERAVGCMGDAVYLLRPGTGADWTVFNMAERAPRTLGSSPRRLPTEQMCFTAAWVSPNLG